MLQARLPPWFILLLLLGRIRPKWPFDPKAAAPFHASSTGGKPKDQSVIKKLLNELKLHSEIMHENQSVCLVRPSYNTNIDCTTVTDSKKPKKQN
jgi:hypothetical protein